MLNRVLHRIGECPKLKIKNNICHSERSEAESKNLLNSNTSDIIEQILRFAQDDKK